MSEWKCGKCGKVYTFDEFFEMISTRKVLAVPGEEDPTGPKGHGYHGVCECGFKFHRDQWRMLTHGTIDHHITLFHNLFHFLSGGRLCKPHRIRWDLSTVFLQMNHGGKPLYTRDLYYETMMFAGRGKKRVDSYGQDRYETKDEAASTHVLILSNLAAGRYTVLYSYCEERDPYKWESEFKEGKMLPNRFEWRLEWDDYYVVGSRGPLHGCRVGETEEKGYGS